MGRISHWLHVRERPDIFVRWTYIFHLNFRFWTQSLSLYIWYTCRWYARMRYGVTVKLSTRAYSNGGLNIWTFKPWLRTLIKLFGTFHRCTAGHGFWYHINVKIIIYAGTICIVCVMFSLRLYKNALFRVTTRVLCSPRFQIFTCLRTILFFRKFLFEEHIKLMIHYSNKDRNNESSNGVLNGDELWTERCREKNPPPTLNCSPCFR